MDQGLDDDGGEGFRSGVGFQLGEILEMDGGEVDAGKAVEEGSDRTEAGRSRRVAVVGSGEAGKTGALRMSVKLPILERHLEGCFHSRGAVVGVEDPGQGSVRQEVDKPFGQLDRSGMGRAEEGGMIKPCDLLGDSCDDAGMGVAVDVGPDRGIAVEVFFTELD